MNKILVLLFFAGTLYPQCSENNWIDYYPYRMQKCNLKDAKLGWETNNLPVDLSGANLSGADLSGADLSGVNLSEADLSDADLSRANLKMTNLLESNLSGANLESIESSWIKNYPASLPKGWSIIGGFLINSVKNKSETVIARYEGGILNDYYSIYFKCYEGTSFCPDFSLSEEMNINLHPDYIFHEGSEDLLGRWFKIEWANVTIPQYKGDGSLEQINALGAVMLNIKMIDLRTVESRFGLNVRIAPSINSKKVGRLQNNSLVNILSNTELEITINDKDMDTGKTKEIYGKWVKVETLHRGETNKTKPLIGYVFDGFLSKPSTRFTQVDYYYPEHLKNKASTREYEDGNLIYQICWDKEGNEKDCK